LTDLSEMAPHDFWQEIHPPGTFPHDREFTTFYVATLEDGRQLRLPIRVLADGDHALASLIVNQASFAVLDALADGLAEKLGPMGVDVVAGLPTLGLTLAAAVAQKLGHGRYVPLGTSRKFWYREELSVPMSSITSPEQVKRLYLDPRMLPLVENRRVLLVDDEPAVRRIAQRMLEKLLRRQHAVVDARLGHLALGAAAARAFAVSIGTSAMMAPVPSRIQLYAMPATSLRCGPVRPPRPRPTNTTIDWSASVTAIG